MAEGVAKRDGFLAFSYVTGDEYPGTRTLSELEKAPGTFWSVLDRLHLLNEIREHHDE